MGVGKGRRQQEELCSLTAPGSRCEGQGHAWQLVPGWKPRQWAGHPEVPGRGGSKESLKDFQPGQIISLEDSPGEP